MRSVKLYKYNTGMYLHDIDMLNHKNLQESGEGFFIKKYFSERAAATVLDVANKDAPNLDDEG